MSNKSENQTKFEALNEFVQIEPISEGEQRQGKVLLADVRKDKPAKGTVLSVGCGRHLADGTLVKPAVEPGDMVVYNPHMIGYELKDADGKLTIIISSLAIYGRLK
jgi:co-chaperonin GroES (HSP10)